MKNRRTMVALGFPLLALGLFGFVSAVWGWEVGRMTGGGSVFLTSDDHVSGLADAAGTRITHGFELHCALENTTPAQPNNLQINIHPPNGGEGRFHLENLLTAECNGGVDPSPPQAPFFWYKGSGTGRYNGEPGYCAYWIFTDEGEPGTNDRILDLEITNCAGAHVLNIDFDGISPTLTFGNHQAHRLTGRP